MRHRCLWSLIALLMSSPSFAQDDDDELPSGLLAEYSTKDHTVRRVDPDVAFVWDKAAPDDRLRPEPFTAQWNGRILLRGEGKTRWHAFVRGRVEVRIDNKVVVRGETGKPAWVSGDEFDLGFGEKPFAVTFARTGDAAQLKLFWSSNEFPLEPLPYHVLFHESPAPEIGLAARGRVQFDAFRCANCHGRVESRGLRVEGQTKAATSTASSGSQPSALNPQPFLPAPSLKHVGQGTSRAWLIEKVIGSRWMGEEKTPLPAEPGRGDKAETKMPHFGFTKDEAEAVVAALIEQAQPVKLDAPPKRKDSERDKDLKEGRTLIRSAGCLACHTHDKLGEATPFGGGSLSDIGQRRSADWLATWLAKPSQLNEHARMPVVALSDKERAQIVLALLVPSPPSSGERARVRGPNGDDANDPQEKTKETPHPNPLPSKARGEGIGKEDPAQVAHGRKLIESSRCSACHELARPQPLAARPRSLARGDLDWTKSCVQTTNVQPRQPQFLQVDEKAIRAYVASWGGRDPSSLALNPQPSTLAPLHGRRLLEQKNCLACHDRDESKGLSRLASSIAKADESLAGLHMTLIPPRLHAVGDRLHDMALAEAIQGGPKHPRLSWLRVRMPRYQHSPVEQAALLAYLIGHDRVPARVEGQNAAHPSSPVPQPSTLNLQPAVPDPQRLLAGRELLGGKGFSCVACHAVKDYTPKVTALGTRGSNLHLLGQRMRTDYYFRWTRAPLRIMPGVEMPNYQRPHEFILPGQLDQQLTAIWEALNDPNLTSPTNPAVVEQLLTINKGERPRIVRDVFTVAGTVDDTVARAFAVGFDNGHSLLFDLDTGSVRAWTLGDFARQRCEGKRWYWDLAGTVLATRFDKRPDLLFVNSKTGEVVAPETGWQFDFKLRSHGDLDLRYGLKLSKGDTTHEIEVAEVFRTTDEPPGWERTLAVFGLEQSPLVPWHRGARPETLHEAAAIEYSTAERARPNGAPTAARPFGLVAGNDKLRQPDRFVMTIRYTSSLRRVDGTSPNPPAPPLTSAPDRITSVPGFRGERLPLPRSIMPTAMTFDDKARLIFTSLKGHVYRVDLDEAVAVSSVGISESAETGSQPRQPQAVVVPSPPSAGERGEGTGKEQAEAPLTLTLSPADGGKGIKPKTTMTRLKLTTLIEGLAAPFGVTWLPGDAPASHAALPRLFVAHKPELLSLYLTPDDTVFQRDVFATGWGITDDYHDWTCGIVRDSKGSLYVVLGSDYAFKARPKERSRWRGDALRIAPSGQIESIARGLRFPTGVAMDDQDRLFVTDQQGVQNTFNELNYIQTGHRYGVPSRHEPEPDALADPPAIQIPHPWTRSVNGLVFVSSRERRVESQKPGPPKAVPVPSPPSSGERARVRGSNGDDASQSQPAEKRTPHPNPLPSKARGEGTGETTPSLDSQPSTLDSLAGHFLAAEYNNNSIIRMSVQEVDGVVQGAVYPFSRPTSDEAPLSATPNSGGKPVPQDSSSFIGPMCLGISPTGDIYVGGFQDGGWAGGLNMGDIVKLAPEGDLPNGLREIRATSRGFDLEFFHPVDVELARQPSRYKISGYTRVWQGDYATPDSGRHTGEVTDAKLDDAARTVSLTVRSLKPGHVYDVSVGEIGHTDQRTLWPAIGHYTLHRIPQSGGRATSKSLPAATHR